MARKKGKSGKLLLIVAVFVIIAAITGGGLLFFLSSSNRLSRLPSFPTESYLIGENLWSLEDQAFKIEGRIDKVIMPSADRSTILVSVQPDGSERRLPVLVSKKAGEKSIRPEQELILKIDLGGSQELRCSEYATR